MRESSEFDNDLDAGDDIHKKNRETKKKIGKGIAATTTVLEASNEIADCMKSAKAMKGIAILGAAVAVMEIVMIWMPETPSAELVAIKNMVNALTNKIEELHGEQMQALSQISRNQFFLHSVDKTTMLDQLLKVQEKFRMTYNKRAIEYVCGKGARDC